MGPRRIMFILVAIVFSGLFLGANQNSPGSATAGSATAGSADPGSPKEVTYNRDVAPILYKNCVVCHRPNDIAPMSLMTYKDTRPWARPIREAVVSRKMPPWHADPKVGDFINDPRLTDAEIATIDSWVRTGAKEGDPKDLPPAPVFAAGWHIKPDVVLTIPEFTGERRQHGRLRIYLCSHQLHRRQMDSGGRSSSGRPPRRASRHRLRDSGQTKWRRKWKSPPKPTREKTNITTAPVRSCISGRMRRCLTMAAHRPMVAEFRATPSGGLNIVPGIYLPGHLAETRPPGFALRIPAGAYLQFQIHYSNHSGEDVKDRTSIGLVFAREPVKHEIAQYEIWNNLFLIPPNADNHRVTSCFTLPKDVTVVAYTAHMHFRGKSMKTEAIYPDGQHEVLLNVPNYDFRWQETYFLKHQFLLPKGTKLVTTAYFDNSLNNPQNPDPSKAIRWGEPSDEEMMGFWLQFADPKLVDDKAAVAHK